MATPGSGGSEITAAVQAFSDEVFEAMQRLLRAQHQLSQEILGAALQGQGDREGSGGNKASARAEGGDVDAVEDDQDNPADQDEVDLSGEDAAGEDLDDEELDEQDELDDENLGQDENSGEDEDLAEDDDLAEDELGDQDGGEAASDELGGEEGSADLNDEQSVEDEREEDEGAEEEAVPVAASSAPGRSGRGRRR
jgi:hypothetical protein